MVIDKTKPRVSRRDKLKKSPVPWAMILLLSAGFFFFSTKDKLSEWSTKKESIETYAVDIKKLDQDILVKASDVQDKEDEFENLAGPRLSIEKQIFPAEINNSKLVKVLELFSIQLLNISEEGYVPVFSLDSLSLGSPTNDEDFGGVQKVSLNINITTDQKNLETFIDFLQSNKLPDRITKAYREGLLESTDYKILETQILPVMLIDAITKSETQDSESLSSEEVLKVSITGSFYFQPQSSNDTNTNLLPSN